jgi:hypothetical protein
MACPFFLPVEKLENGSWSHAGRLPLGCGWSGECSAPGHEGELPSPAELREFCNLGYAATCTRLPKERPWDSIRFGARTLSSREDGADRRIQVRYVCEREHLPAEHGRLEFDVAAARWIDFHRDQRVQRMAECFLESYVDRKKKPEVTRAVS